MKYFNRLTEFKQSSKEICSSTVKPSVKISKYSNKKEDTAIKLIEKTKDDKIPVVSTKKADPITEKTHSNNSKKPAIISKSSKVSNKTLDPKPQPRILLREITNESNLGKNTRETDNKITETSKSFNLIYQQKVK